MNKGQAFSIFLFILTISSISCNKSEIETTTAILEVKTYVSGYGHVENVNVSLVNRPSGNYVEGKMTDNRGIVIFENLQPGKFAVDCEYIISEQQVDYITISDDFDLNAGDIKVIEITVD